MAVILRIHLAILIVRRMSLEQVDRPTYRPFLADTAYIQGDQLYMAVFFWYLVKSDLFSVRVYSSLRWTSHFLQGTRKTRPCLSGQVVSYV